MPVCFLSSLRFPACSFWCVIFHSLHVPLLLVVGGTIVFFFACYPQDVVVVIAAVVVERKKSIERFILGLVKSIKRTSCS